MEVATRFRVTAFPPQIDIAARQLADPRSWGILTGEVAMSSRDDLTPWIVDALRAAGGSASATDVRKYIWAHHESDLGHAGGLFYTWQYDVRWAATKLRKAQRLRANRSGAARIDGIATCDLLDVVEAFLRKSLRNVSI